MGWPVRLLTRAARATASRTDPGDRRRRLRDQPPALDRHPARRLALAAQRQLRREGRGGELPRSSAAFLGWHGTIAVRRGESDRDAVRLMREAARDGHVVGLFVEGTRQRSGVPDTAQPGAAMVAIQEDVPVVPVAVYGTQFWKLGNFAPLLDRVRRAAPRSRACRRTAKGYREATAGSSGAHSSSTLARSDDAARSPAARARRADGREPIADRHGRDRRLPERRQVDARQPPHRDARRRSSTRRRARRATARSSSASGTGSSSC